MRITQNMMSRGYIKRMNSNLAGLAGSNNRLASGQKYTRISQNTSANMRALVVREQLHSNETASTTIKSAQSELEAVEGNMQIMNTILQNAEDRLLQANTGTLSDNDRQLIARELEGLQGQIMQIANAQFGDKYLFAGSGTGRMPFEDKDGVLHYNGYVVDDIVINPATGKHAVEDPANPGNLKDLDFNKELYIDVGLGVAVNGSGANAALNTKTAIKISTSGLEAFGFGKTTDGVPKNLYSLFSKMVKDVKDGNTVGMDRDIGAIKDSYTDMLKAITDVGTRATYLNQTWDRLDNESINLKATQQDLESVSLEEESISNKMYEMSWMVTLQLGSKIIPPSIFDFIK